MKKRAFVLVFSMGLALCACEQKASDQELDDMCANLLVVRGETGGATMDELKGEVEEDFAARLKRLEDWKARDMKGWEEELNAKLEALAPEDEEEEDKKAKKKKKKGDDEEEEDPEAAANALKAEYAKKMEVGGAQFDKDIAALGPAKEKALAAVDQKLAAKQAELDKKKQECIEQSKKRRSKRIRLSAASPPPTKIHSGTSVSKRPA